MTGHTTRAERMAQPRAADAIKTLAEASGGCIRPVQLRRTDLDTGQVEQVIIPCGVTLATLCPACAERAQSLRAAQCREGWHLENEPIPPPATPDDWQTWLLEQRAELQQLRDRMHAAGDETAGLDELIGEVDTELARSGIRGNPDPGARKKPRHRSTRRRQDAPALPRRAIGPRTTGKVYTAPGGKMFRPSMFLTLTLDSYGRVLEDGTPANRETYDYRRAARDAIHFARWLTGSSRTCAASSATTCSILPPSNRNGDWRRTPTSPCAAPSPAPTCAKSWGPLTTRSGGHQRT